MSELISEVLGLEIAQPEVPKGLTLAGGMDFSRSAPAIGAALCRMQADWASLKFGAASKESVPRGKVFSWKWAGLVGWLLASVLGLYGLEQA